MSAHPGWFIVVLGAVLVVGGLIWMYAPWIPLGRLPGDIRFESGSTRVYIPITTCILASIVLSAIFWVVRMLGR
jgi:hypothetical protein